MPINRKYEIRWANNPNKIIELNQKLKWKKLPPENGDRKYFPNPNNEQDGNLLAKGNDW